MKLALKIILLACFASIALFGIWAMHLSMPDHDGGCLAAAAQGADCPRLASPWDYLAFHLNTFKNLSAATPENSIAPLLIFALVMFGLVLTALAPPGLKILTRPIRALDVLSLLSQMGLFRYLALQENSPTRL